MRGGTIVQVEKLSDKEAIKIQKLWDTYLKDGTKSIAKLNHYRRTPVGSRCECSSKY